MFMTSQMSKTSEFHANSGGGGVLIQTLFFSELNTHHIRLQRIQWSSLRTSLGLMTSTHTGSLEAISGIQPIDFRWQNRRNKHALNGYNRFGNLHQIRPDNPRSSPFLLSQSWRQLGSSLTAQNPAMGLSQAIIVNIVYTKTFEDTRKIINFRCRAGIDQLSNRMDNGSSQELIFLCHGQHVRLTSTRK